MTEAQIIACYERWDEETPTAYLLRKSDWPKDVRKKVFFYGGRQEDYEEILNESFVRFNAAMLRKRYERKAALRDYFMGICNNLCKEMLTDREKKRKGMEEYIPIAAALRAEEIQGPDWRERFDQLMEIMQQLDDKKRTLLELYMAGWSHEDIAQAIDLKNADTSKSTFGRLKEFLRQAMKFILLLLSLT